MDNNDLQKIATALARLEEKLNGITDKQTYINHSVETRLTAIETSIETLISTAITPLVAWQNRAMGLVLAITVAINLIVDKLKKFL